MNADFADDVELRKTSVVARVAPFSVLDAEAFRLGIREVFFGFRCGLDGLVIRRLERP